MFYGYLILFFWQVADSNGCKTKTNEIETIELSSCLLIIRLELLFTSFRLAQKKKRSSFLISAFLSINQNYSYKLSTSASNADSVVADMVGFTVKFVVTVIGTKAEK